MKRKLHPTKRTYMILFSAVFLYVVITLVVQWREYTAIQERAHQVQEETEAAALKKQELQHVLQYADTNEFIESVVRDKLGWVKKGEIRYVEGN